MSQFGNNKKSTKNWVDFQSWISHGLHAVHIRAKNRCPRIDYRINGNHYVVAVYSFRKGVVFQIH